jgi:release factor glutamine methyltransferase
MPNIAKITKSVNSRKLFVELLLRVDLPGLQSETNEKVLMLLEKLFGLTRSQLLLGREVKLDKSMRELLSGWIDRLNNQEPVQYIVGEAHFYGRTFKVNPDVLIPRPETEELVDYLVQECPLRGYNTLLDIGTGSGCIAVSLKLALPQATVYATDISEAALLVAAENALEHNATIYLKQHDILKEHLLHTNLDLIVSNPPYIGTNEEHLLEPHVLNFEPHTALFAPAGEPLAFYKTIARKGIATLKPGGMVAVEINERYGEETAGVFLNAGYDEVAIHQDLSGKDRFVTAVLH